MTLVLSNLDPVRLPVLIADRNAKLLHDFVGGPTDDRYVRRK